MANENLKKQMVVKLGTTTNTEAQLISNMVDGALSGKGGDDPELESLKKQMVIKLGTTTNEDAQIISNMVDNAAGGGGGGDFSTAQVTFTSSLNNWAITAAIPLMFDNNELFGTCSYADFVVGAATGETTVTAILYKNVCKAILYPDGGLTFTLSGNASYDDYNVIITGDCTITVISDSN